MKLALALAFALTMQPAAWAQFDLLSPHARLEGFVLPVYAGADAEPIAVWRANRIFLDHQRRGFFRIGLLPMWVCDGVTFEFRRPEAVTNALSGLRTRLEPSGRGPILELRHVAFRIGDEPAPRLQAGTVRIAGAGPWQMLDVACGSGTNCLRLDRAELEVAGPDAGRVSWKSAAGAGGLNLFAKSTFLGHTPPSQRTP